MNADALRNQSGSRNTCFVMGEGCLEMHEDKVAGTSATLLERERSSLVEKLESPQRSARRHFRETRIAGFQRVYPSDALVTVMYCLPSFSHVIGWPTMPDGV